ncbi:MAG: hypothetical protein K6E21_01025 [Bacilli bacterium]|nr:hypothetical protein [Bacilli bacterium]
MNSGYFYEYANLLERIFSYAYKNLYSYGMVEKKISNSSFFQAIEKNDDIGCIIDENSLIKEVFELEDVDMFIVPTYKQCMWIAESYLTIQKETHLTFEAIFLYIPIKRMYEYYPLYHEMDFSEIVDEFNDIYKKESIFSILLSRFNYSLKDISDDLNISYDSLCSYKQRRRDISKIAAGSACKLASIFRVRVETLIELKM